jgi:hypothetical protein
MPERAIWLEPDDPKPADMKAWFRSNGLDPERPIRQQVDSAGWVWYFQDPAEGGGA